MTAGTSTESVVDRDAGLRRAHRRAFAQIRSAADRTERERVVADAVRELVDACQAYLLVRA